MSQFVNSNICVRSGSVSTGWFIASLEMIFFSFPFHLFNSESLDSSSLSYSLQLSQGRKLDNFILGGQGRTHCKDVIGVVYEGSEREILEDTHNMNLLARERRRPLRRNKEKKKK